MKLIIEHGFPIEPPILRTIHRMNMISLCSVQEYLKEQNDEKFANSLPTTQLYKGGKKYSILHRKMKIS